VCIAISLLAFLPWYLLQTKNWASGIRDQGYPPFHWTLGLLQDVLKSVAGDGFLCSAALIFLAAAAFVSGPAQARERTFLLSTILLSIGGALAGDSLRNYFFASRQIVFAVPGLVILAALGFFELYRRSKPTAMAAAAILLGAALQKDVTMETDWKEDWRAAASAVADAARSGRCLEVVPAGTLELYDFFVPGLGAKACAALPNPSGVALISHLYTPTAELTAAESHLRDQGFTAVRTMAVGGTNIALADRKR
jgi:hypothetical protein